MKKIELCLMVVILTMVAFLFAGCEEELANKGNLREQLLVLNPEDQARWDELYGDSLESQQVANILMGFQTINNQAKAIQQLDDRLTELEDPNTSLAERVRKLEEVEDTTTSSWPYDWPEIREEIKGSSQSMPYIYKDPLQRDPNSIAVNLLLDTVCTKHGRITWGGTYTIEGKKYCGKCMWNTVKFYLDKYIADEPNGQD